jgi:hypothetical protein
VPADASADEVRIYCGIAVTAVDVVVAIESMTASFAMDQR